MAADDNPQDMNQRKVRAGLAMVTVVFVVSLVMLASVDSAAGKAVFFAIACIAAVRAFLLFRWVRSSGIRGR